jgi:hypothetical protein
VSSMALGWQARASVNAGCHAPHAKVNFEQVSSR